MFPDFFMKCTIYRMKLRFSRVIRVFFCNQAAVCAVNTLWRYFRDLDFDRLAAPGTGVFIVFVVHAVTLSRISAACLLQ